MRPLVHRRVRFHSRRCPQRRRGRLACTASTGYPADVATGLSTTARRIAFVPHPARPHRWRCRPAQESRTRVDRSGARVVAQPAAAPPVEFERTPPQNIEAEQCVLGGMLLSKDAIADVVEVLRADRLLPARAPDRSTRPPSTCTARGEPADPVTVAAELTRTGELGRIGGAPYLHTLRRMVPTAASAGYYARIVARAGDPAPAGRGRHPHRRSSATAAAGRGRRHRRPGAAGRSSTSPSGGRPRTTCRSRTCSSRRWTRSRRSAAATASMPGVPTGFDDLDALTNGLHPGQLIILAARPAIGKSTLGLDFARAAAIKHGKPSVIFSLEMSSTRSPCGCCRPRRGSTLQNMRTGRMSRRRLGAAGAPDGRGRQRAAVHRRQPEPHDDGDPGEVPAAQAAQRPQARRRRLPAADELAARRSRTASRRSARSPGR